MIDDDGDVLDELREQLRAAPSAAFSQRVRERIARPASSSPVGWPLVIGAAAASVLLALVARTTLIRPPSADQASARMRAQTTPDASPVQAPAREATAPLPAVRSVAPVRAAELRGKHAAAFGETLVPDDQREAIERLLAGLRLRHRAAPVEAVMSEIDDDGKMTLIPLAIAPLTPIEPLAQTVAADIRGGKK